MDEERPLLPADDDDVCSLNSADGTSWTLRFLSRNPAFEANVSSDMRDLIAPQVIEQPDDALLRRLALQGVRALVPGDVHSDLMRAGVIDDVNVSYEELRSRFVAMSRWSYAARLPTAMSNGDGDGGGDWHLRFACLDTVARVYFDDATEPAATVDNQFRTWYVRVPVAGARRVRVDFDAVAEAAQARRRRSPLGSLGGHEYVNGEPDRCYVRKSGAAGGWDWGAAVFPLGIARGVRGLRRRDTRLPLLRRASLLAERRTMHYTVNFLAPAAHALRVSLRLRLALAANDVVEFTECARVAVGATGSPRFTLSLPADVVERLRPWREAAGADDALMSTESAALYDVDIELRLSLEQDGEEEGAETAATQLWRERRRVGFRDVRLTRGADGRGFQLTLNDAPVFVRGANLVPLTLLPGALAASHLDRVVMSARRANFNALRVWGGGEYPSDALMQRADALGLMLLVDFQFACTLYPAADDAFVCNVVEEIRDQLSRMSSHASVVLYFGNNEIEEALDEFATRSPAQTRDAIVCAYAALFERVLPREVTTRDGTRPYWPSSPSSGGVLGGGDDAAAALDAGDAHYWGVWHGAADFSVFNGDATVRPRFCSEYGFQSFPSVRLLSEYLLETTTDDDDGGSSSSSASWTASSPAIEFRQRSPARGNAQILEQIARHYELRLDGDVPFHRLAHASQATQALAMRAATESFRRQRPRCNGALYWQLNDIWPGASWSSLEFEGGWKLLHYAARDFFRPLLASFCVAPTSSRVDVWLTNDTRDVRADVRGGALAFYAWRSAEPLQRLPLSVRSCVHCRKRTRDEEEADEADEAAAADVVLPNDSRVVASFCVACDRPAAAASARHYFVRVESADGAYDAMHVPVPLKRAAVPPTRLLFVASLDADQLRQPPPPSPAAALGDRRLPHERCIGRVTVVALDAWAASLYLHLAAHDETPRDGDSCYATVRFGCNGEYVPPRARWSTDVFAAFDDETEPLEALAQRLLDAVRVLAMNSSSVTRVASIIEILKECR